MPVDLEALEAAYNSVVVGTERPTMWMTPEGFFVRKDNGDVVRIPWSQVDIGKDGD